MNQYRIEYLKNLIWVNPGKSIIIFLGYIFGALFLAVEAPPEEPIEYKIITKFDYNSESKCVVLRNNDLEIENRGEIIDDKLRIMTWPFWYDAFLFFCFVIPVIAIFTLFFSLSESNSNWDIRDVSLKSKMKLIKCNDEIEDGETFFYYTILGRLVQKSKYPISNNDVRYLCGDIDISNLNIYPEYLSKSERRLKKINKILN